MVMETDKNLYLGHTGMSRLLYQYNTTLKRLFNWLVVPVKQLDLKISKRWKFFATEKPDVVIECSC
jgi:hypothetical protein